jgi:hypothetical protein
MSEWTLSVVKNVKKIKSLKIFELQIICYGNGYKLQSFLFRFLKVSLNIYHIWCFLEHYEANILGV